MILCLYNIYLLIILKKININIAIFCKISYRYRIEIEILISNHHYYADWSDCVQNLNSAIMIIIIIISIHSSSKLSHSHVHCCFCLMIIFSETCSSNDNFRQIFSSVASFLGSHFLVNLTGPMLIVTVNKVNKKPRCNWERLTVPPMSKGQCPTSGRGEKTITPSSIHITQCCCQMLQSTLTIITDVTLDHLNKHYIIIKQPIWGRKSWKGSKLAPKSNAVCFCRQFFIKTYHLAAIFTYRQMRQRDEHNLVQQGGP